MSIDPLKFLKEPDEKRLLSMYSDWLDEMFKSPIWKCGSKDKNRIPWQCKKDVEKEFEEDFKSKGIYLFGTKNNIIRYIGITGKPSKTKRCFKRRLRRYIHSKSTSKVSQIKFAEDYIKSIEYKNLIKKFDVVRNKCSKGNMKICDIKKEYHKLLEDAAKDFFIEKYLRIYPLRCKGAVDFALHGIDGMWFSILPVNDKHIEPFEKKLIPIANIYNMKKGNLPLINDKFFKT